MDTDVRDSPRTLFLLQLVYSPIFTSPSSPCPPPYVTAQAQARGNGKCRVLFMKHDEMWRGKGQRIVWASFPLFFGR